MTIPLAKAIEILESAEAVIVDNDAVTYGSVDTEAEEFFSASWTDSEGDDGFVSLLREHNEDVTMDGSQLVFKELAEDGTFENAVITPLFSQRLASII